MRRIVAWTERSRYADRPGVMQTFLSPLDGDCPDVFVGWDSSQGPDVAARREASGWLKLFESLVSDNTQSDCCEV
jgi:hypothetical protein